MTTVSALIYGTERTFIDSYSTYSTVSVALLPLLYPALIIKVITQYVDRWKPSAVSLHSSARVFLHISPTMFFYTFFCLSALNNDTNETTSIKNVEEVEKNSPLRWEPP